MENKNLTKINSQSVIQKPKSVRDVWQCLECANKTQEKPEVCASLLKVKKDYVTCGNKNFIVRQMYCLDKINSYNCFLNAIIGKRRGGKTFAVIEHFIRLWENTGKEFVWIRRYKTETVRALDAVKKFGYFHDKKGVYYEEEITKIDSINDSNKKQTPKKIKIKHYFGHIITISTASRIRGGEFNNVFRIGWDEYGDEAGTNWNDENTLFNSIITSVFDEKSNCKVYVLSNNVNRFLPIYQTLKVKWEQEWTLNWNCDAVAHVTDNEGFELIGSASKWLKNSDYYDYAFQNKAMDLDEWLVESWKIEFIQPEFCFKLGIIKEKLGVFITNENIIIATCENCNHDLFVIDTYNKALLVKHINEAKCQILLDYYNTKKLRFTLPKYKQEFLSWVNRRGFE